MYYEEEDRTKDEIFAKALIHIIEGQIELKKHLGIIRDDSYYGECYYDGKIINALKTIE